MNIDVDTLKKQQLEDEELEKSFTSNKLKVVIQQLFQNQFHEHSWAKYSVEDAKQMIIEHLATVEEGPWSTSKKMLMASIKKMNDVKAMIFKLNDYLFS